MTLDAAVAREPGETRRILGVEAGADEAARSNDERHLSTAGAQDLRRRTRDDPVHRPDVGRPGRGADDDDAIGRRGREDRPTQASESHDVAVDGAGREEDRRAEEQHPGREDDRPVRPAAVQERAPQAG